ncbi:MAG: glycosyltransferase family 4 protein [Planctomycetaceae bacterium]|nr:glycosyltransferase family 4 protein [Planctomycetaceae bacterium]
MLDRFATDVYLHNRRIGAVLNGLARVLPGPSIRRLAGRYDSELPDSFVSSFPWFGLQYRLRSKLAVRRGELTAAWLWAGREFANNVVAEGLGEANVVYGYSSAALELFQAAKRKDIMCVLDHATAPKRFEDRLTAQQASRYEGWSSAPPLKDRWVNEYADRQHAEAELADVIVCGSTFVKNAVDQESRQGTKCRIVPLGLRKLPENVRPKSSSKGRRLRILFVGDEAIRKGIGDLCRAIELFGTDRCNVRVAGNIDLSEYGRAQASRTVELLGAVPRSEMRKQYEWADVCLLPSVSDTFGLVILEAMSLGVPVITTPNTGGADVVTEGVNGYIVPVMSPETIAARMDTLDADRGLLTQFSTESLSRSLDFGIDHYGNRLVSVVRETFDQKHL